MARQGFCDVYQEKQSQRALKDSDPRLFVQASANCRNFGVEWLAQKPNFQLLMIGALIAI